MALDLVTGSDPEDAVTADAAQHISGSFAAGLDTATLKGKRIGAFRQRFVGFTGEREVAANMERVIKELQSAGAIVVDVADSRLRREVRGRARRRARIAARRLDGVSLARIETRRQGADDSGSAGVRKTRAGQRAPSRRRAGAGADRCGAR